MRDIKLAIFDFDNTLWENFGTNDIALKLMVAELSEITGISPEDVAFGMQQVLEEHLELFHFPMTIPLNPVLQKAFPGQDLSQKFAGVITHFDENIARLAKPYDGMRELLETLQGQGIRLACYSESPLVRVLARMRLIGIAPFFELLCACPSKWTAHDAKKPLSYVQVDGEKRPSCHMVMNSEDMGPKSHPEVFSFLCAEFGVTPDQAIMVGDHPVRDVANAMKVGVTGVFAGWGCESLNRLELVADVHPYFRRLREEMRAHPAVEADLVAKTPADVAEFLFS